MRDKESGWSIPLYKSLKDWIKGKPADWPIQRHNPWRLPEVSDEVLGKALATYTVPVYMAGKKRKATTEARAAAPKKSRTG